MQHDEVDQLGWLAGRAFWNSATQMAESVSSGRWQFERDILNKGMLAVLAPPTTLPLTDFASFRFHPPSFNIYQGLPTSVKALQ